MTRPSLKETLISVVLPVFNEARVLEELQERVHRAVVACGTGQEIIFVNDGSTDETARILDSLAQRHAHVRVIHLARNFGHQAAVQAGLCHAKGDAVVLMDSDLQDAPEAIGRLVAEWITGYDVVYALRRDRPEAIWKRCLFATFHRLLSCVASTRIPVDAGNFSIIDARVVREIVALGEHDRYLPGLRSWVGFRQRGIEINRERRYDDKPRVSLRGLWRLAKTAIFSFSSFPLTLFYVIGYSALLTFLALGGYALYCKALTTLSVPGWTSNVLVASFFGAVNALGICILGEYVIRIYDQVRGRPLFVVEQTRNLHPAADNLWPDDEATSWPGTDRRAASGRRAERERRAAIGRRAASDRRDGGGQRASTETDFASEDYLAFAAEFDAENDLVGDDWRTELETDADYMELMAEAESLMALVLPATAGAKLHWPESSDETAESDDLTGESSPRSASIEGRSPDKQSPDSHSVDGASLDAAALDADASFIDPLRSEPRSVDPLNVGPLKNEVLDMDEMWLAAEQLPGEARRRSGADLPALDERLGGERSDDHRQSAGRRNAADRLNPAHDDRPAANAGEPTDSGASPDKAGRRNRDRKGKERRGE